MSILTILTILTRIAMRNTTATILILQMIYQELAIQIQIQIHIAIQIQVQMGIVMKVVKVYHV